MDSAAHGAAARRRQVDIVYRRSREELPARGEEVEHAEHEGVMFNISPRRYGSSATRRDGCEVECLEMELGEPDASGRRKPVEIKDSSFLMKADAVIVAIGNSPNPLIPMTTPGLEVGKKGNIEVDEETGKTSRDGIWAGGDVVTGAATVISAMGAGRKAAKAMHETFFPK